jgi:AhpC/TSA family protein
MKRRAVFGVLGLATLMTSLLVPPLTRQLRAEGNQGSAMKLKVGDMAPDFKLQYFDGKELKDVSLSEYKGKKNVVLAFYVFAFTGG